jgi:hypothetical protein
MIYPAGVDGGQLQVLYRPRNGFMDGKKKSPEIGSRTGAWNAVQVNIADSIYAGARLMTFEEGLRSCNRFCKGGS